VQHLSLRPQPSHASIPPAQSLVLPVPDKPSIAVLPFINLSGDPKQDYFSDGITDYLITDLSHLPDLLVIARNSTFTYKGKAVTVQQVGRELGVRAVLEGSVFKASNQVRITVQVADATTGANLWAARFDKPLKDVFTVQDEIVREIVTTLNLMFKAQALKLPPGRIQPTDDLQAFDYWLRGVEASASGFTKDDYLRSQQFFEKAIALDPNYADAYGGLAINYILGVLVQYDKDPKTPQRVVELAQRAIALDDSNWAAYLALGEYYGLEREYDRAITYDQRAIALDPNNPITYFWYGDVLSWAGKPAETISVEEKATRLDPRNGDNYAIDIGWAYGLLGQYAQGLPYLQRHAKRYPDNIFVHIALAVSYAELDHLAEARAEGAEIMRLNPQFSLQPPSDSRCPYKDEAQCQREMAALRKAGLK
jgi:adenylate cyclase